MEIKVYGKLIVNEFENLNKLILLKTKWLKWHNNKSEIAGVGKSPRTVSKNGEILG